MIPLIQQDRKLVQNNNSDVLGNLYATFGVDLLSNQGKIRASDQMFLNTNSTDQSNLGIPIGFRSYNSGGNNYIFTVGGSRVFQTSTNFPSSVFTEVSGTPTDCSSDYSDIETFNSTLYVTTTSNTVRTYSGSWSSFTAGSADSNHPHMLCQFASRMYMTTNSGLGVISWDNTNTVASLGSASTINFSNTNDFTTLYITFLRASSNRIWIGTINMSGGKGYVYEWDGASLQATKSYRLDSGGAVSCVIKNDVPYIMNTNGVIQVWNGGTFKDLDEAQVGEPAELNRVYNYILYNPLGTTNDRFVHPNGMSLINGEINVLVNTVNYNSSANTEVTLPAGIYEYLPNVGLYHKTAVNYVRPTDTFPYTDGGQMKIASAGALAEMNTASNNSSRDGTFLCGAKYYDSSGSAKYGIWYNNSFRTAISPGYFITNKIYSQGINDMWQKAFTLFRKLNTTNEKIIGKYRMSDSDPTEATITWVNTSQFTTTADLSLYAVGDEVQVIRGIGSGFCAHITTIAYDGVSTYTVVLDETFTGATGTAIVWVSQWVKMFVTNDNTVAFKESAIGKVGTWVQYKIWFNFKLFDEIENIISANVPNQKAQ